MQAQTVIVRSSNAATEIVQFFDKSELDPVVGKVTVTPLQSYIISYFL
jgi:hypothetical protein